MSTYVISILFLFIFPFEVSDLSTFIFPAWEVLPPSLLQCIRSSKPFSSVTNQVNISAWTGHLRKKKRSELVRLLNYPHLAPSWWGRGASRSVLVSFSWPQRYGCKRNQLKLVVALHLIVLWPFLNHISASLNSLLRVCSCQFSAIIGSFIDMLLYKNNFSFLDSFYFLNEVVKIVFNVTL